MLPIGMVVNMIAKVAIGNNVSVGSATAEMELLDSSIGKRLAAAVDGQGCTKYTGRFDKFGKWNDTKYAWTSFRISGTSLKGFFAQNRKISDDPV